MKITFALLEKYKDIIDFTISSYDDCACPSFEFCEQCPFYNDYCALDLNDKNIQHIVTAFRNKYPELFI